jgi:site-specific recombinase XerC
MTLKAWFGWLMDEPGSDVQTDPTVGVTAPAVPLAPTPIAADEDLTAILATCRTASFVDLRDAAIIRVLVSCGLRRAELVGLDVDGLDLNKGLLYVMGKGSKPRLVALSGGRTSLAVSRYLRLRRKHPASADPALFLSTRTRPSGSARMGGQGVAEMLNRRCRLAGVPPIHPHQLRHGWADSAKRAGISDEALERLAGWSSPMMVRRYGASLATERANDALRDAKLGDRI